MIPSYTTLPLALHALTYLVPSAHAAYTLQDDYNPSNFLSKFQFFTGADPTHGYVDYLDETDAEVLGLVNTYNNQVYLGVDHSTIAQAPGRSSVRLSSTASYNHGLIILDLEHMPGGICGTWPAFWLLGPNWPNNGEVDIIENVNSAATNQMTLHSNAGCTVTQNGLGSGTFLGTNCDVDATNNEGCSVATSNSQTFGAGFNAANGGVYATEWTSTAISIWFFPRSAIPADITAGTPNPANWGMALAEFSGGCDIDAHFKDQQIVFDTTFCGDWAGAQGVWSADPVCGSKAATCQEYVMNNPTAFTDAYWAINGLKVYQNNGAAVSSSPATTTTATTTTAAGTTTTTSFIPTTFATSTYVPPTTTTSYSYSYSNPGYTPTGTYTNSFFTNTFFTASNTFVPAANTFFTATATPTGGFFNGGGGAGNPFTPPTAAAATATASWSGSSSWGSWGGDNPSSSGGGAGGWGGRGGGGGGGGGHW